ncbi:M14 family zinc carboxypeptidase [Sphingobacterium hotanense]|uniref:M14 family zinc carboxypeptidase n=1 Tax=Sphingobacterium hotanense TaxID=649196 RepID=UPI0021A59997|nr:M14 family zinc carboxypeptidase [Sphingobacterium hotanense]MCT1523360.1 hypothetical protein [Sphingobacterium hotanense]
MKQRFIMLLLCSTPFFTYAQWNYPKYNELKARIQSFSSKSNAQLDVIGKSFGAEQIPIIKIQQGKEAKPTLLLVAGIDGKHPAGTINALNVAERLLDLPKQELADLLANKSIWILPLLNADAYKRNANHIELTAGNARQIDFDRDGRIDEDPEKDLNGDGFISQMRVKSPAGTYRPHLLSPDFLVLAEKNKGEAGIYELYKEGVDADKDGFYGEDGLSGVNLDRNFTYDYPFFESETGDYAASEPETRALMNLIFDNPQIAVVLHFGIQNNLSTAEVFDQRKASERIMKSWTNNDAQVSALVSHFYKEAAKELGDAPKMPAGKGNFSSTAYYHAGKFSFVTPSWWIPATQDSSKTNAKPSGSKDDDMFVRWVKANNIQGAILPWTKVNHPDFPNQEVEVGGKVERFQHNPPVEHLNASAQAHSNFVVQLMRAMASLEFSQPKITPLGDDIFRIEVRLFNTGALPIYPEIADKIKHVSKLKSVLELQKNQSFLSGKRLQLYPSLGAGKSQDLSWLVKGRGRAQLTVGCPTAGMKVIDINL